MTDEELRAAARKVWDQFNAHDLDYETDPLFAPAFENANSLPGTPPGPQGMRDVAERLYSAFPDMRFEVEEVFSTEQGAAVLGWMSGTQHGDFGRYPPTGNSFRARQIHTYTFNEQGHVARHLAVRDDVAMLTQLGHPPVPAEHS